MLHQITWRDVIVTALKNLGGRASLDRIYREVERLKRARGIPIMRSLEATVRHGLERHCSDSANYGGGPDLFYCPEDMGAGVWGLRRNVPLVDLGRVRSRFRDPVEREAMVIARDKVGKPLNGKGVKRKDVSAAHMTKMARQALERHPEWREVARKIMRARMGDIKLSEAAE